MKTELLFQTVHSVNQISIYAAVTDWCYQFGLTGEVTEQVAILVDNKNLTMMEPEVVEMLVSLPNLALGSKMQGSASFRVLEKKIQITQLCEKTSFQHIVTAGNCYKVRPDDDDGWVELLLYDENIQFPDLIRKPKLWQPFPQVQFLDQFWKFML